MQDFWKINRGKLLLFLVLVVAAFFRFYGLNWDQGYHLHPDERQIVLVTTRINFSSIFNPEELFSKDSSLNPHFFAYGNFPIYFLKFAGNIGGVFDSSLKEYEGINLVGRLISVVADLGTIFILFSLGKKVFNEKVGLIAAFLYGVSVLPIQATHFYAVDILLTFFILATLYRLLIFYGQPTKINALIVGILFGLSLATKTSAFVLLIAFGTVFSIDFLLIFLKQPHRLHVWFPHIPKIIKILFTDGLLLIFITIITFMLFEPYALIDFKEFWRQTLEQSRMTRDAFTFPYTLQYVGKTLYFYELKNVFLWGQGPILAILSFLGTLFVTFRLIKHLGWWQAERMRSHDSSEVDKKWAQELILLAFLIAYFLVVGKFAIGFMRYMLPLYPLLSLFAAVFFLHILSSLGKFAKLFAICYLLFAILWPVAFINIYTQPNTRVLASQWINKNIPSDSIIAVEHWDDSLPLFGQQNYRMVTLPLYDPDTREKWQMINQKLAQTDYIIIASNRLYAPLPKLTDCVKLPPGRCYPLTTNYYKNLFNGSLGFQRVAEFSIFPTLKFRNLKLEIDDSSADESFTVYDHPRVMIFKKRWL